MRAADALLMYSPRLPMLLPHAPTSTFTALQRQRAGYRSGSSTESPSACQDSRAVLISIRLDTPTCRIETVSPLTVFLLSFVIFTRRKKKRVNGRVWRRNTLPCDDTHIEHADGGTGDDSAIAHADVSCVRRDTP
jgi:hypothetical protein